MKIETSQDTPGRVPAQPVADSAAVPGSRSKNVHRLRAWLQLLAGLLGYAISIVLMLQSGLGLGPWDALHVGIHNLTGIPVGLASILAGVGLAVCAVVRLADGRANRDRHPYFCLRYRAGGAMGNVGLEGARNDER